MRALVACYAGGAGALFRRDLHTFLSYRTRFISQIVGTFFTVILFYYVSRLVRVSVFGSPGGYFAYVVVGLVIMGALVSSLSALPGRVRQELVAGTFERVLLSPFGPVAAVSAAVLFPLLLTLIEGVVTIAFAVLAFDMPIRATAPLAVPTAALAALSFTPFALLAAATVIAAKQAQTGIGFAVTGISLISGVFFPVSLLPGWIQWTTQVQPFTPALMLLRHLIAGTPMDEGTGIVLLKLVIFVGVFIPVGWWVLSRAIRLGQRRGTIIEY